MIKNDYKGVLVAFDGPNGSGKTTLVDKVKKVLVTHGYSVYATKEPTSTELGDYVRAFSEEHNGISLACMVACDRYEHLTNEVVPKLEDGLLVLTDRYILSSLILQGMDGVDIDYIMNINDKVIKPDLQIAVYADSKRIQERLCERDKLTRFERNNQSVEELVFMKKGINILNEEGVNSVEIWNNNDLDKNVDQIVSCIEQIRRIQ